ncbi:MAG: hypothetical protein H6811_01530 [Phycisphaeraceae bacterium]|nr:hypothetical protein [Phycisphaeraceae bacterium]
MRESRLPPDRFYWGMIDPSPLRRGRRRSRRRRGERHALGLLFEPLLPVPLDSVQTAFVPVRANAVVACAMDRGLVSQRRGDYLALGPDSIPSFLGADTPVDVGRLNLLTGACEPHRIRRLRRLVVAAVCVASIVVAASIAAGLFRREREASRASVLVRAEINGAYERCLGPALGAQSRHAQLQSELRRLRITRSQPPAREVPEAVGLLERVLLALPRDRSVQVESLLVSQDSIQLEAEAGDLRHAELLIASVGSIPDWTLSPPTVTTRGDSVRVSARLSRSAP